MSISGTKLYICIYIMICEIGEGKTKETKIRKIRRKRIQAHLCLLFFVSSSSTTLFCFMNNPNSQINYLQKE